MPTPADRAAAAAGLGIVRNIQVVADKDNNTLLIVATAPEYTVIEAAVKKLDIPARQVMIEVTIAQVALTDEINFGVEWLFKGGAPSGRGTGGNFTRNTTTPINPGVPGTPPGGTNAGLSLAQGFVYIINNANFPGGIQAVLHLLDTYGDTKVIANPHLGALDNQKATIKSGDRIPINQQTNVGGTVNGVVTTTSQYIDTGVLLQVTPHINAGGLVTLDVQAEVSDPGNFIPGEAPPINTRSVQTMVSVQSGQTMVMGGLIGETKQMSSVGPAAAVAHPDHRRSVRRADDQEQSYRAHHVHHAARGRERVRREERDRRSAPPDGDASTRSFRRATSRSTGLLCRLRRRRDETGRPRRFARLRTHPPAVFASVAKWRQSCFLRSFREKASLIPDILLLLTCNSDRTVSFGSNRRLTMPGDFYSLKSRIAAPTRCCSGSSQSVAQSALDQMHGAQS